MRLAVLLLCALSTSLSAQDTSFSQLRLRGSLLRNPEIGHIGDDWRAKTGGQVDLAANVGRGELGLSIGHVGYGATTGKPSITSTLFTLGWMTPVARRARVDVSAGARLTDLRMDFDDPALVGGLRTEEEVILSAAARGRIAVGRGFSAFLDASYGMLMLETKTPIAFVSAGVERSMRTPNWLRDFLR